MDDKEAETLPLKPDRDPGAVNLAAMHALFARQLADASRDDGSIDFEALSSVVADVYVQASASRNAHAGRLKAVLEQIMHGVCFFDAEQRLIGCNRRYAEIYGLRPDLVRPGITLTEIVEHRTLAGSAPVMAPTDYLRWRSQVATDRRPNDSVIRLRNGRVVSIRHQPIPDGGWVAMHEDITDQLETDRQLDYLAAHDAVTGLLNRTMLAELLCQRLSRCSRSAPCAVLSLSLDRFEAMGDTLGRSAIDELLRMMSDRLRQQLRPGDLLGYAARNEFVIVCCGAAQPDDATRLARQLPELIARPAMLHGQRLAVTASVGVAVAFAPGPDPEAMLRNSRTALNRARTGGRGRYRQFDPEMDMRLEGRRLLELDLRDAVSRSAFDLHYQPQVNTQTRRINGLEALLRWTHPVRGPVSPELFIPLAEELGLIDRIGTWVLEQACIEAASWPDSIRIAVNVSALQLRDGKLPGIVANALRRSGLAPGRLELEITESRMLEDASAAGAILARLREAGVRIAMDDFGTGYSSLSSLASLPFDKVKVDRSLIAGLGKAPAYTAIVRALVSLCANLCISCTAEGVETEQQLAILAREHCPEVQGHLLGRPGPARDIPDLLRAPGLRGPDHDGPAGGATPGMPASASGAEQPDISFAQIVQTANDIIIVTTADLDLPGPKILYVNPAFTRLTGYAAHEALGLSPRLLQGPGTSRATLDEIGAGLRAGREVHQKVLNFAKSGAPYWLDLRIVPFRDSEGRIVQFVAIERDVTLDKRRLDELEYMADRDTLTGIPNRRALLRTLDAEIRMTRSRGGAGPCLAYIDVDHFKRVNDEHGHPIGDAVLFGIADRLAENVRRMDVVGRIGGEEFAVCMPSITLLEAAAIGGRLRRAVTAKPFDTPAGPMRITISIGVSEAEGGEHGLSDLMRRADGALYAAKRAGRNRVATEPAVPAQSPVE